MDQKQRAIDKIREFNRFYMPALGLLGNRYLGSAYSPAEARVLCEVYRQDGCNAAHIARVMNLDKSYLSRILKGHEKNGYLVKTKSEADSRSFAIHLTDLGVQVTEDFIRKSNRQIGRIIESLDEDASARLVDAMNTIISILERGDCSESGYRV